MRPLLDQLGLAKDQRGNVKAGTYETTQPGVFAAGDGTTFPIRQGGVACQQAAVAAASAARHLGADVPAKPLAPCLRGALTTVDGPLYLEHDLASLLRDCPATYAMRVFQQIEDFGGQDPRRLLMTPAGFRPQ